MNESSPISTDAGAVPRPARWPRLLVVGSFLPGFELDRYAGGALAVEIGKRGGTIITTSNIRSRPLRLADMMRTTYLRRRDFELAHITVFSGRAFFYAECVSALLRALGKKCTMGLHGGNLPRFARRHPRRTRRLLEQARFVACPSGYLFEEMKPFRTGLHLIPNAIDITRYPARTAESQGARLLWLRAFHQMYNPTMAVRVLAQVLSCVPAACMTMVGPDKGDGSFEATKRLAVDLRVLERINFRGPVAKEKVPEVMARHDVFINTTTVDNAPVSVVEALACGLPVVSTDVGGLPYLLEQGKTALLVKNGDVEGMAEAVCRLFRQPRLRAELRERGRRLAESFDWSVVLPQWHRLFTAL